MRFQSATRRKRRALATTETELFKVALELERTTSAYYQSLVEELPAEHRHLFSRFLEIELGHLAIVQAELDALMELADKALYRAKAAGRDQVVLHGTEQRERVRN